MVWASVMPRRKCPESLTNPHPLFLGENMMGLPLLDSQNMKKMEKWKKGVKG
jgi:hypothetical protein